ncbi:NUDIX hydrolase [Salinactinospora qingdaonensis]|uniref:CoA pyrophosphatase n=1 Tax=Salinactinospora qingdaonensis TaxID=702744 RepID=A0ABP7FL55_9ACTN
MNESQSPNVTVPSWLTDLAEAAQTMTVPPALRPPRQGGRHSAVLVLFAHAHSGPEVLLIQRADGLRRHSGQPAFPGGALEAGDIGPAACALREAYEETGLDPAGVTVLDTLPELYISPSQFRVTPVLAWWHTPSEVRPVDTLEVAGVARVPVAELADPANRLRVRHPAGFTGPAFRVREMLVWGFTAGLLNELLILGGWERPWHSGAREEPLETLVALRPTGGTA